MRIEPDEHGDFAGHGMHLETRKISEALEGDVVLARLHLDIVAQGGQEGRQGLKAGREILTTNDGIEWAGSVLSLF